MTGAAIVAAFLAAVTHPCAWPHPPRMEMAERIRAYLSERDKVWNIRVCVDYRRGKPWCSDLPGSYDGAADAWRAYREWHQHVTTITHAEE